MWPWKKRKAIVELLPDPAAAAPQPSVAEAIASRPSLPTVKFNPKHVTDEVRSDIAATLQQEKRLSNVWTQIYPEAVLSVEEGRNLARLARSLQATGWTKGEAGELALHVHNRATGLIARSRQLGLGITEATWLYSGAACHPYGEITPAQKRLDELHKAANGQKFQIAKGMKIGGRYTWPGMARYCKCLSKSILPGLS